MAKLPNYERIFDPALSDDMAVTIADLVCRGVDSLVAERNLPMSQMPDGVQELIRRLSEGNRG